MKERRILIAAAAIFGSLGLIGWAKSHPPHLTQGSGALSPQQLEKVHSRLFPKGPVGQITDMLSRTTRPVNVPCVVAIVQTVAVPFVDELGMLAADSDLVVLGKTGTGVTHMNADKDFLYTDWSFTVEEVLKNNANSPVQPGAMILVTRPGGKLQINGRMVYAACGDFLDFAPGREYLLYLRFVPGTGAYAIGGGSRAFATSPTIRRLDSVNYPEPKAKSQASDKDALLKVAKEGVALSTQIPRR